MQHNDLSHNFSSASMLCALQLFNCTLDYSKAQKWSKQWAKDANATANGIPDGLCTGHESLAKVGNTYSDVSQLRITYRSVLGRLSSCNLVIVMHRQTCNLRVAKGYLLDQRHFILLGDVHVAILYI